MKSFILIDPTVDIRGCQNSHIRFRGCGKTDTRTEKNNGPFISADALVLNQRAEPLTESVTHLMSELYLRYFPRT